MRTKTKIESSDLRISDQVEEFLHPQEEEQQQQQVAEEELRCH